MTAMHPRHQRATRNRTSITVAAATRSPTLQGRRTLFAGLLATACVTAGILAATPAKAQTAAWPAGKPIKLIAVFPPGGSVDQVARALAPQLSTQLGVPVVVENKGGGSGSIGAAAVAQAAPDGLTWGVVFDTHGVNASLIPNLPYDTQRSFANVMLIGTAPMVIATHASQPYKNFAELLAASKTVPGGVAYGTIGSGSLGHLAMTQISNQLGVPLTHVPYRGGGPLVTDAVGNQVPVAIGTVFLLNPHIRSGKLRALGVTSPQPDPQLPGVTPLSQQGVAGFEALAWWGVIGPAGTPAPVVARMNEELAKALKAPAVAERLTAQGLDIASSTPDAFERFLKRELERWQQVVRDNKIKAGE